MVAPLGRRSGRKSSQVRKICFSLWTWTIVVVAKLGNTSISRVVTRSSPWMSQQSLTVWKKKKTTSSESKGKLGRSGKGLVTALAFKTKVRFAKIQKGNVCHRKCQPGGPFQDNQIVWKIVKVSYVKRIPKHEPTYSCFHLVRCIVECMMRSDEHNWHVHCSYEEETALSSNVNVTDEDESK